MSWLNGKKATEIALNDRGLMLADGHFSTIKVLAGQCCHWHAHRQRLTFANERLGFAQPDWPELEQHLQQVVQDHKLAVLRITFTRGSSGRGYAGEWLAVPNVIVQCSAYPEHYWQWQQHGISLQPTSICLSGGGPLVGMKTLARTEQVLLRQALSQMDADDLIVADDSGAVIEASAANLFFHIQGQWCTPALHRSGIAGTARQQAIFGLLALGYDVAVRDIFWPELTHVDAAFMCNALMGIVPVHTLAGRALTPSSLIIKLQELLC